MQYAVLFVTVLLAVSALFGERGLIETLRVKREYAEASQAVEAIRAENARLLEAIRRLNSDPRAIEDAARRDLGLMRPGELLVIVRDVDEADKAAGGARQAQPSAPQTPPPAPTPAPSTR